MSEVRPVHKPASVGSRREPEDGTGVEFPVCAPNDIGTKVIPGTSTARSRAQRRQRGITIVSQNDSKRKPGTEGVRIINHDTKPDNAG